MLNFRVYRVMQKLPVKRANKEDMNFQTIELNKYLHTYFKLPVFDGYAPGRNWYICNVDPIKQTYAPDGGVKIFIQRPTTAYLEQLFQLLLPWYVASVERYDIECKMTGRHDTGFRL
jgi:hypothetical protein